MQMISKQIHIYKGRKMTDSQFETGRMENYKRDFYINSHAWAEDPEINSHAFSNKFEFTDSTGTTETGDGFVFRIPLSEISLENLKVLPAEGYIIVQSNRKTIFISLDKRINRKTITARVNGDMLILKAEKQVKK